MSVMENVTMSSKEQRLDLVIAQAEDAQGYFLIVRMNRFAPPA